MSVASIVSSCVMQCVCVAIECKYFAPVCVIDKGEYRDTTIPRSSDVQSVVCVVRQCGSCRVRAVLFIVLCVLIDVSVYPLVGLH